MKKMTLNLDELQVDSFRTDDESAGPRGTVKAHSDETTTNVVGCWSYHEDYSCAGETMCDHTCSPWNGWCNQSQGHSPMQTQCDFSCEFACP